MLTLSSKNLNSFLEFRRTEKSDMGRIFVTIKNNWERAFWIGDPECRLLQKNESWCRIDNKTDTQLAPIFTDDTANFDVGKQLVDNIIDSESPILVNCIKCNFVAFSLCDGVPYALLRGKNGVFPKSLFVICRPSTSSWHFLRTHL